MLFVPNVTAGSTAILLEEGKHSLGGNALVHPYIRLQLHSYCDNKGFIKSTASTHARVSQSTLLKRGGI